MCLAIFASINFANNAFAQDETDYRQAYSKIYHTILVQPIKFSPKGMGGDSLRVDFQFRTHFSELLFMNRGGIPEAIVTYSIALRNEDNIIIKRIKISDTVQGSASTTVNEYLYFFKNFTLHLANQNYTYEIDIDQPERQNVYNKRGKIEQFDGYRNTSGVANPFLAYQLEGRLYASVLDSALDYRAEKLFLLLPVYGMKDKSLQCKVKRMQSSTNIGFALNTQVDRKESAEMINEILTLPDGGDNEMTFQRLADFPITYAKIELDPSIYYPGNYQLSIDKQTFNFSINYLEQAYSLKNLQIAMQVLPLIMNEQDYNILKTAENSSKYALINEFFKEKDTNPQTAHNEAMNEFFRRVDFAAKNYGDFNNNIGYKTARGKIYIIYGAPDETEIENNKGHSLEVWNYNALGKTIRFQIINGEHRLINENEHE